MQSLLVGPKPILELQDIRMQMRWHRSEQKVCRGGPTLLKQAWQGKGRPRGNWNGKVTQVESTGRRC